MFNVSNFNIQFVGKEVIKITYDSLNSINKIIYLRRFLPGLNRYIIRYLGNARGFHCFWYQFINPSFRLIYFDEKSNELFLRVSGILARADKDQEDYERMVNSSIRLYIETLNKELQNEIIK